MSNKSKSDKFVVALNLLLSIGYKCDISLDELKIYLSADTFYQDLLREEILENVYLLAHEIVEVCEIKRMGLVIDKDVIIKHHRDVYKAHLKAAELELELAKLRDDWSYISRRLKDVEEWCKDPLLPEELIDECKRLYEKALRYLQK